MDTLGATLVFKQYYTEYNKIPDRTKFVKAYLLTPAYTMSERILTLGSNGTGKDQQKL